jgi:hypothetical protein
MVWLLELHHLEGVWKFMISFTKNQTKKIKENTCYFCDIIIYFTNEQQSRREHGAGKLTNVEEIRN